MGEPVEVLDEVAQSGIGELANVIAGRAGVLLGEKGHQTLIAPPTIIMGEGTVLSTLGIPRLLIPVHTPLGEVELQLAAKEMR
jgi:chemotaxis protein CheX